MVTKKKTTHKKTRRKVAGRTAVKRKIPGWVILLSGMFFGLLVAVIGYVNGWVPKPDNPNGKPIAQSSQTKSNAEIEDKSSELQIKVSKNYDFYETLQDMEVVVDEKDLQQIDSRTAKSYTLQLGAFKNLADAETLKAQVAFVGITAYIQDVNVNQTNWHRVRVGPYTGGRKADVAFRSLERNGFNAIIVKEK